MPGRHIWHPSVLPEPASNMHARPFKSITRAMGDTFILADVSVRRRFDSPKQRRRGGKTNGTCRARGSCCRRDISRSGAEEKAACWSERGLKIARDRTKTAQLLKWACTEHVNAKHLNPKTLGLTVAMQPSSPSQQHAGQLQPRKIDYNQLCHHRKYLFGR